MNAAPVKLQDDFEDWMDARAREFGGEWFDAKAAGVTYPNADGSSRQDIIATLEPFQELRIQPEPNNPYDKNAIALLTPDGRQAGYFESRLGIETHRRLAAGSQIRVYVRVVRERNGQRGLSFAILQYKS